MNKHDNKMKIDQIYTITSFVDDDESDKNRNNKENKNNENETSESENNSNEREEKDSNETTESEARQYIDQYLNETSARLDFIPRYGRWRRMQESRGVNFREEEWYLPSDDQGQNEDYEISNEENE